MKIYNSIQNIAKPNWQSKSVFTDYVFFNGLEQSGCVSENMGWDPLYFSDSDQKNFLYSFQKTHSYGEYIFDWGWADAYHRSGYNYYPKLTSMVPFTPATVDHFIMDKFSESKASDLLSAYHDYYLQGESTSSHFLFIKEREIPIFQAANYSLRESFQYHFNNKKYQSFNDFLSTLKSRKAKQIKKERASLAMVNFQKFSGDDLTAVHAKEMYHFYQSTITLKGAHAYLNEAFFMFIFEYLKHQVVYVQASINGVAIAGSFFLFDKDRLYGRYWGCSQYVKNLHFELCYYQGIDFLIEQKLSVFEAGAQGEHKIARGFVPTRTYSAHSMRDRRFHDAVDKFIIDEKKQIKELLEHLHTYLPFRMT